MCAPTARAYGGTQVPPGQLFTGTVGQRFTGWNRPRTSHGDGAGRARVGLAGATAGAATGARAGVRSVGAATAGWTRPERLTGTTRLRLVPRLPSSSIEGGAGGAGRAAGAARYAVACGVVDRTVVVRVVEDRTVVVRAIGCVAAGAGKDRLETTRGGGSVDSFERRRVAQPVRTTTDPRATAVNIRITILLPRNCSTANHQGARPSRGGSRGSSLLSPWFGWRSDGIQGRSRKFHRLLRGCFRARNSSPSARGPGSPTWPALTWPDPTGPDPTRGDPACAAESDLGRRSTRSRCGERCGEWIPCASGKSSSR